MLSYILLLTQSGSFDLFNSYSDLLEKRKIISYAIGRDFLTQSSMLEFATVVALLYFSYQFINHFFKNQLQEPEDSRHLFRYFIYTNLWPVFLFIVSFIVLFACVHLWGYFTPWYYLLFVSAPWLILIRSIIIVLKYIFPKLLTKNKENTIVVVICCAFFIWITNSHLFLLEKADSIFIPIGKSKISLLTLSNGLLWSILIVVFALWVANVIESQVLMRANKIDFSVRLMIAKITKIFFVVVGITIALPIIGVDITTLAVFGAAFGAALGIGFRMIASNYLSGFIILMDKSVKINDRVTVDDFTGYVVKMTGRYVAIKSLSGVVAFIPNETFIAQRVLNESYTEKQLEQELTVQVAYGNDLSLAMSLIEESVIGHNNVNGYRKPLVTVSDLGPSGIEIIVSFWVIDPEKGVRAPKSDVLMEILRRFEKHNINISSPRRNINIIHDQAIHVPKNISNEF